MVRQRTPMRRRKVPLIQRRYSLRRPSETDDPHGSGGGGGGGNNYNLINKSSSASGPSPSSPAPPPTWPPPAVMFPQFAAMPAEIRHLVWEFYLAASPRIHVVHEEESAGGGEQSYRAAAVPGFEEALPYTVTTLDAATNARAHDGLRTAHVSRECAAVARRLRLHRGILGRGAAFWLARDLERPTSGLIVAAAASGDDGDDDDDEVEVGIRRRKATRRKGGGPVHVDWTADLIFVCSASNEQAFRNLAKTSWAGRIQRLAVLVPRRCESNIPFGPGSIVSLTLRPMVSLREIYVVMIPHVRPALDPTGPGNSWGRDRYGFVNYVDYLREIGITTKEMSQERHMTYQRTALSLMQALAKHLEMPGVRLRKVVDVDCTLFTEGAYERRERWLGIKPKKE